MALCCSLKVKGRRIKLLLNTMTALRARPSGVARHIAVLGTAPEALSIHREGQAGLNVAWAGAVTGL